MGFNSGFKGLKLKRKYTGRQCIAYVGARCCEASAAYITWK